MNFEIDEAAILLRSTPPTLRTLLEGLPVRWTESHGDRRRWRPHDIVGHLIHGERTDWIPRARMILEQGADGEFVPFDREAMFESSRGKSLEELLAEFASLRTANLEILESWDLSPADLELEGRHPEFGAVTLGQLLASWVVHDLSHLAQISRSLALDYREQCGPWIEYMSILRS